jgi:phosphoglycolate phosphatase
MAPRFTPVLIDLDGTIVDSAPGILSSLAWTHEQLRMPVPPPAEMLPWIGPPLLDSFRDFAGLDEHAAQEALAVYRDHYGRLGAFDAQLFPGVAEVLREIHESGVPLSLATSKPESTARRILDHFELSGLFTEIAGASDDETRSSKADVVAEALRRLAAHSELERPVHVGDRHHDVEGAAVHDVPTIFVSWGYGAPAETAGAIAIAASPAELRSHLAL